MSLFDKYQATFEDWNCCVLIPTYNNDQTLKEVLTEVLSYTNHLIVINDGSTDGTLNILKSFAQQFTIVHLKKNSGKGIALQRGFEKALELNYLRVITLDSDGQHFASDFPGFFKILSQQPEAMLIGTRNMEQQNVPGKSNFGHRFSNFWYAVMTGVQLPDTQCGYRLYPLFKLQNFTFYTPKFEFEMEVLVRGTWSGIEIHPVPIQVYYAPDNKRVTHFRTVRDFTRITILNIIFVALGILYFRPRNFFRQLKKKRFSEIYKQYILSDGESNIKIALAVMLGLFIGVSPLWGFQIVLILFFCVWWKLNKAIALIAGNISLPPIIPFILCISYKLGGWALNIPVEHLNISEGLTFDVVKNNLTQYVAGSFILGGTLALVFGGLTLILLLVFRR